MNFKIGKDEYSLFLILKTILAILGSLHFIINLRMDLSVSAETPAEDLVGILLFVLTNRGLLSS